MKNEVYSGDTLDLIAPSGGVTSGKGVLIGQIFAIAAISATVGLPFAGKTRGCFDLDAEGAVSNQDGAAGDPVYWDDTNKRVTRTSAGNRAVGVLAVDKATAATTARVLLVPRISELAAGVAALKENNGAIGGTNDGNLPDLSTVSNPPTQAEVTAIRDAVRELAAKVNAIIAA